MQLNTIQVIKMLSKFVFYGITLQVMFLTVLIAADGKAQNKNVKEVFVHVGSNYNSLSAFFDSIENQSDYKFAYSKNSVANIKDVSLTDGTRSVYDVLMEVSKNKRLKFTQVNYSISVEKIKKAGNKPEVEIAADMIDISGQVKDENDEPLPGVNIFVKGTTTGTISDADGRYRLQAEENNVLVFSSVGYITQEVTVGSSTVIDLSMKSDTKALEELVVVGYGTEKKVNLTGAISAVETEELNTISTSNLSNALAGRAPGVNITNASGLAGASSAIRIRGSFGEPLYVIDGIIRDKAAFDALNANEVEQLNILKDAATASIYGSQAGNGVVLVTTKKGVNQEPTFNYQGSYTISTPTLELLSDKTTAIDELIYQNRVAEFQGTAPPNGDEEFAYFADKNYNVHDFIWQNPTNQRHLLSVNGGNEKVTYYVLSSYRTEDGSYKNLEYDKFNLRSNVSIKLNDKITLDLNLAGVQENSDRFYWPFTGDDDFSVADLYRCTFNWPKTYPFYLEEDGTPANYVTDYPVQTPMGSWQAWSVIDQVIGDRYIKTRERELNSIMTLNFDLSDFVPGLSTKVMGNFIAGDYMRKKYLTYQENYVYTPLDADGNRFIPAPPDPERTNIFTFSQNQEFLSYEMRTSWSYQFDWFVNYDQSFGKNNISAMAIYEQREDGRYAALARGEDPLTNYDQMFVYSTDAERRYGTAGEGNSAYSSLIGRLNYNFSDRYIAEFSFRYDGNTLFPEDRRWGFFPSVSAAWRINEEPFMQNMSSWLDNLKIRGSYGTTGNSLDVNNNRISAFSFRETYGTSGSYIFGDDLYTAITPGATPNVFLTWATSTTYNAGFDIGVFNNQLSGSFEVFKRKEEDILGSRIVTLPDTYGRSLAPENYAARSWRGFEFSALWQDRALNGQLRYSIYGNLGFSKDQWDVLDQDAAYGPGGNLEWRSAIGRPVNRIIGYKSLGIVRTQEQLDQLLEAGFKQFGRDPYLGGLYFEDIRGDNYSEGPDGKIDGNDVQILSENNSPRINYGLGFNLSWKNFTVDAHFQGVGAYDRIISNKEGDGMRQHGGNIRPYYPIWADDVWTPDNPDGEYPRPIGQNWYESGTGTSSFWITDGAYIRLKNLNIGYNLPLPWVSALRLKSAQLFFNGNNLFVFSAMKEFHDPEQDYYDSYPIMKSFTFGIDVKF